MFRIPSELEKCFIDITKKVKLIKKQYILTLDFYESEFQHKNKSIEEINKKDLQSAWINYMELAKGITGEDDYESHQTARTTSGLNEVEHEIRIQKYFASEWHEEFLDSYSKSILLMTYSLIEAHTKRICEIAEDEFNAAKRLKNYRSLEKGYINSCLDYLNAILGFQTNRLESKYIEEINHLRIIRNIITHANSFFSEADKESIRSVIGNQENGLSINEYEGNQLIIRKPRYVFSVFTAIACFFQDLLWLIDFEQENKILKERLLGLFSFACQIKKITIERKLTCIKLNLLVKPEENDIPTFICKIIFSKAKSPIEEFEMCNQMEHILSPKFLKWLKERINSMVIRDILEPFLTEELNKVDVCLCEA